MRKWYVEFAMLYYGKPEAHAVVLCGNRSGGVRNFDEYVGIRGCLTRYRRVDHLPISNSNPKNLEDPCRRDEWIEGYSTMS